VILALGAWLSAAGEKNHAAQRDEDMMVSA
jgi:hypothetical protein